MRTHASIPRPQRRVPSARRIARPGALPRPARPNKAATHRIPPALSRPASEWGGFVPDPYVDFGRSLTAEGGVLIHFKDYDLRPHHTLWRLFAWSVSTGFEGWFLLHHSPLHQQWLTLVCFVVIAIVNILIVAKPIEIYRSIEIRPDCMIIEGTDIFWARFMDAGLPTFLPNEQGDQVLCGIYGTRFIQYVTIPRFDPLDRAPEVFAIHLQDAMNQLWTRPI